MDNVYTVKNFYASWWEILLARIFGVRVNYEGGKKAGYRRKGIVYITEKEEIGEPIRYPEEVKMDAIDAQLRREMAKGRVRVDHEKEN